ncbi:MAG: formyltransferase family protein [Sphingomicrobium sp.]
MHHPRIRLFAKRDIFSQHASAIAQALFGDRLQVFHGGVGDRLPDIGAEPALLVSFLSPWIVPQRMLDRCGTAINFHPGSVDYPGTGCYNFALYEEAAEFGAVCHHMLAKVDTGSIIEERRFPLFASDSVESLKLRTMATMLSLFHDVMCVIAARRPLPAASTQWTRQPFTRREMEALKEVKVSMPDAEAARRVRATTYPGYPGPFLVNGGQTVYYPVPDRPPLA